MTTSWTATQWIPWMTLISTWIDGTTADPSQTICPAPSWQVAEAEFIQWPQCPETRWEADPATSLSAAQQQPLLKAPEETLSVVSVSMAASSENSARPDHELDTESPLDNANFLSFEDWKKQNLAKVGQSAENVGARGAAAAAAGKEGRRRPTGINNALDSLGEDVEIELDFGGFGADTPEAAKPTSWGARVSTGGTTEEGGPVGDVESLAQGVPPAGGVSRSKDAGTTCKERFNYASFDCAATVLKTNPECTGSSSVLIENKDSYMLNECRANNKFLILELCDDILVDTVVLANYEFFSSIFHTFRVSVSDRYPAKLDQWRELGIYEARNTREVQAFAVENPLIWARYVKIEFLTHYGNEFFCPLSLIRVHGTTMLEEYKHDGEVSRTDDVVADEELEPAPAAAEIETIPTVDVAPAAGTAEQKVDEQTPETCPNPGPVVDETVMMQLLGVLETCSIHDSPVTGVEGTQTSLNRPSATDAAPPKGDDAASIGNDAPAKEAGEQKVTVSPNVDSAPSSATTAGPETTSQGEADSRSTGFTKEEQSVAAETTRSTATQPPSANPTTQESFFKSVNKRLQMLESNSSLSLLYIEEQSRILRDAFNKVEKRQLAKTSTFLEQLNVTVLHELKQFREQYDNVWKSVALEFEHQRIQYHQEVHSLSAQLGVLADELVFQKRVAVIQSIMILFCFGLVLFSRGAVSSYIELPSMQNMVSRSYSLRSSSPPFGSPSVSPTSSGRRTGGHRRNLSEDSQEDGPISPTLAYSPPTPVSDVMSSSEEAENHRGNSLALPEVAPPVRSRSSPPDLKGGEESIEESSSSGESPVSHGRNAAVAEAQ